MTIATEFTLLLLSQVFFRAYLLFNPVFISHVFPNAINLQALISQLDSFGVVFGAVAGTTFIILSHQEIAGLSENNKNMNLIVYLSVAVSVVLAFILTRVFGAQARSLQLSQIELFSTSACGSLAGIIVGLLSGVMLHERRTQLVLRLVFWFYILKLLTFALLGALHLPLGATATLLNAAGLASAIYFLVNEYGVACFSLSFKASASNKFYLIYFSESSIGFARALTPMLVFLMLMRMSQHSANYAYCLTYAYLFGSLCNVPILAGMPLALRTAMRGRIQEAQAFFVRRAAIPAAILFVVCFAFAGIIFNKCYQLQLER